MFLCQNLRDVSNPRCPIADISADRFSARDQRVSVIQGTYRAADVTNHRVSLACHGRTVEKKQTPGLVRQSDNAYDQPQMTGRV